MALRTVTVAILVEIPSKPSLTVRLNRSRAPAGSPPPPFPDSFAWVQSRMNPALAPSLLILCVQHRLVAQVKLHP